MIIHTLCFNWLFILTCWLNKVWHGWLSTCALLRSKPFVVITFSSHPIWWMWWVHGQACEGSWIRSNRSGCLRTLSLFFSQTCIAYGLQHLLGLLDYYWNTVSPVTPLSLFVFSFFLSCFFFSIVLSIAI